jgi:4-hydroxy-2-oxoheptanedioate aldolase
VLDAIRRIADAANAAGIRAGLHCGSPDYAARAIGWGYHFVTVGSDARHLAGAAAASVGRCRALFGAAQPAGGPGPGAVY